MTKLKLWKNPKLKLWQCSKTKIVSKTQIVIKLKLWWHSKTQIVRILKKSNNNKIQKPKMLKKSKCDKTWKLKLWQNSNSNCDKTQNVTKLEILQISIIEDFFFNESFSKNIFTPWQLMRCSLSSVLRFSLCFNNPG